MFGYSVSISGDYAIVGAWGSDDYSGSAYIFKRLITGFIQIAKLTASDGVEGDWFGWSVSISEDYAIVGEYLHNNNVESAYIFRRDGSSWIEEQKLTASDGTQEDYFGTTLSILGNYAILGAGSHDHNGEKIQVQPISL